jgi:fructose-1,6-bisphosphatase-3
MTGNPSGDVSLASLRLLAERYSSVDSALGEMARLAAGLTLPKGTIHVISDVHGEDGKLRHILNNASGTLRPLVERLFADRLSAAQMQQFITLIFYPRETLDKLEPTLGDLNQREQFFQGVLRQLIELIHVLARRYRWTRVLSALPSAYRDLLQDMLGQGSAEGDPEAIRASVRTLLRQGRALHFVRLSVRIVRDLAIDELVLAGDCWDRGPRGDKVVDRLRQQPNVAFIWGNHDVAWLGAYLGQEALIAQVLRISLRYRRLTQLEEGYGINIQPLETLARTVYADDPASCFLPRGSGLRETVHMARMQKAAAVMQFKLEGQLLQRRPEWGLEHRRLLHRIDRAAGAITIDGAKCALKDTRFPTLDPAQPYELAPEERACLKRIKQSFAGSQKLAEHIRFLAGRGSMWLVRDDHLIFHGCVPVDEQGEFAPLTVDGTPYRGRALFDALDRVILRALEQGESADVDWLWYLWCGPLSPLFGKDKIATLEIDLVSEQATHVETKNPYFQLLHEPVFCERILEEFGADPQRGIIVNGHVPVQIDKGEQPVKRSGKAITIDGAFSQAYGDHGYTLVLEPERTFLAKHHHFESVEAAVQGGVDIIPEIMEVRRWQPIRRVADTERGAEICARMAILEQLVAAYRSNGLRQQNVFEDSPPHKPEA